MTTELTRREFIHASAAGFAAAAGSPPARRGSADPDVPAFVPRAFQHEEATVRQLQDGMAGGQLTARSITEAYLGRIDENDRRGPALHSVIETNPEALAIADERDAERRAGRVRGPLHGIPILVKDNVATHDRMTTTAGSYGLEGSIPDVDAFVAQRLRAAGAIILGKANLSEWANFRSTRSSSGWSARGGQCRNPYALDRNPCGSSSGTGASISASFATIGIGTETDGSIVCPSSANGLVGIKPTIGLVSRSGIIPVAHSQDTAGPMARTVTDAAILLSAIVGVDPRDPITAEGRGRGADYAAALDPAALRGARIGVPRARLWGFSPEADAIAERALEAMRDAGAVIVDPADLPHVGEYGDSEFEVLLYEFKADLNTYLASLGPQAPARTLEEVIAFNAANAAREMPYFGQEIFEMAQEKGPLTDQAYVDALAQNHRLSRAEGIDAIVAEHNLDALVAPTGSPAWPIDLINGDHFLGGSSQPAAVSGYPNVTVPAGFAHGLPVGLSIFGPAYSEARLIAIAYAFEQATRVRRAPRYLPTADLP